MTFANPVHSLSRSSRSAVVLAAASFALGGQTPTYQHEVLPLFTQRCLACHNAKASGGLDLRTLESLMRGGGSGQPIEPGKPDASLLYQKVETGQMPIGGKRLTREELALVRAWIEKGQFPSIRPAVQTLAPEARINDEARKFWSFQRPVKKPAPEVAAKERVRSPIDAFILQKLQDKKLTMNPDAPREKLIRRAYFDLTGLPPTPEEVAAFVRDPAPNAFEKLVDRLLESPGYGERWARHWLDVAGYADSNGYLGDEPRPYAWQYRDWVIKALNRDMPYNQFLMEQLAGDQMSNWRIGEKLPPETVDRLIATGFLRLTPDGTDNQSIYEIDKQFDAAHAVTEVSVKAVMGLNINCARCHDHKYDPVLQKDYYRIMALYRPVYDPDDSFPKAKGESKWLPANLGWGAWPVRLIPNATQAEIDKYVQAVQDLEGRRKKAGRQTAAVYAAARERWRETQYEKMAEPLRGQLLKVSRTPAAERTPDQTKLLKENAAKFQIEDEDLAALDPVVAKFEADQEVENQAVRQVKPQMIWGAWDVSPEAKTQLLARGNFDSPREVIEPGIPLILDDPKNPFRVPQPPPGTPHTGRRLAFAKWLTQPDHPLTARVIVNRVWQYHFGAGIVATPDDFGSQGARPTHPELLDWLAVSFVENGWSLKWLHREIMRSSVYRQSPAGERSKFQADESNQWLARWAPRRLESEAVRDAVLAVSGQLTRAMYGPPIALCTLPDGSYHTEASGRLDDKIEGHTRFFPPACGKPAAARLDDRRQATRRTIYVQARRTYVVGLLGAYDAPMMETNAAVRFRTAAARQALSALHNPLMLDAAAKLADRTRKESGDDLVARVRRAIELTYARPASEKEIEFGFGRISAQKDPEFGMRLFCQALLASSEFLYLD